MADISKLKITAISETPFD